VKSVAIRINEKRIKILIIILIILLGICILLLAGVLLYDRFVRIPPSSVSVPDNIITWGEGVETEPIPPPSPAPEESPIPPDTEDEEIGETPVSPPDTGEPEPPAPSPSVPPSPTPSAQPPDDSGPTASAIYLYRRNPDENQPFTVVNMFPGDSDTRYYRVRVSYQDEVTVYFKADIHNGFDKLAEVMKVRVSLPEFNEILYDGLMRDMPEYVPYKLYSSKPATSDLYYRITAYLDTSVGSEYMEQELKADFKWWIEETENLNPLYNRN